MPDSPRPLPVSPSSTSSKHLLNKDLLSPQQVNVVLQNISSQPTMGLAEAGLGKETWSRYLVENYFQHWSWYNPNAKKNDDDGGGEEKVTLSKGWAFFEHFTLPRRYVGDAESAKQSNYIRARAGETNDTELYGIFFTPRSAFADWGIGVSMYFSTLVTMCCIFVLVGCLNIANIFYYSSTEYDSAKELSSKWELLDILRFSAVCMDREWVACQGCSDQTRYWDSIFANEYYGTATDSQGEEVTLISRTTCDMAQFDQGMWNFGTLLLLIVCITAFMWYLSELEIRFDEDNTSAPDYTLIVRNPPPDAYDADEWKDFFERFATKQVTLCTIALDNERLLTKLVQRRRDMKALRSRLGILELDFDEKEEMEKMVDEITKRREKNKSCIEAMFNPLLRCLGFGKTERELWERFQSTEEAIQELQKVNFDVSAVYITFETEQGQRTALEALNASRTELLANTAIGLDPSALFRDKVLNVEEASEPTAVRWLDLNYSTVSMNVRTFLTLCVTMGLVGLSAYILQLCRTRVGTILYAVILSTLNFIIPFTTRIMVSYEKHYDEGSMQRSLYIKITLFRWMNTVIVTRLITPFVASLGVDKIDMINTVNALLISETIVTPLLKYFDVFQIMDRHYFAPRAKTLEELYSCFTGGWYNLAERFTDFTKILLLAIFYAPFMPLIYFFCALIFMVQYWMDKFLLLRSWQKAPLVGPESARFSRKYFTTAAVVLGAISSAYAYFHSPFTQLCECSDDESCTLSDTMFTDVLLLNGTTVTSIETASTEAMKFCNQKISPFPAVPDRQGPDTWMTEGQEWLSRIYGWFSLVLLVVYLFVIWWNQILKFVMACWKGMYKPAGVDQRKDFSSGIGVESFGYIPQLVVPGFHFPLLACDIDDIDVNLISWRNPNVNDAVDPHIAYDDYNLIFDIPHAGMKRSKNESAGPCADKSTENDETHHIFSTVKHWPPEWALKKNEDEQH